MDKLDGRLAKKAVSFSLGRIVATPNVVSQVDQEEIMHALERHSRGDWGELEAGDRKANDLALVRSGRLVSAYNSRESVRFWIITEADRSVTTVLLPEDY